MKVVTIKIAVPEFDKKNVKFMLGMFRHIAEELAMFRYPTPTKWPLYRHDREIGEVKVKEKKGTTSTARHRDEPDPID